MRRARKTSVCAVSSAIWRWRVLSVTDPPLFPRHRCRLALGAPAAAGGDDVRYFRNVRRFLCLRLSGVPFNQAGLLGFPMGIYWIFVVTNRHVVAARSCSRRRSACMGWWRVSPGVWWRASLRSSRPTRSTSCCSGGRSRVDPISCSCRQTSEGSSTGTADPARAAAFTLGAARGSRHRPRRFAHRRHPNPRRFFPRPIPDATTPHCHY